MPSTKQVGVTLDLYFITPRGTLPWQAKICKHYFSAKFTEYYSIRLLRVRVNGE